MLCSLGDGRGIRRILQHTFQISLRDESVGWLFNVK